MGSCLSSLFSGGGKGKYEQIHETPLQAALRRVKEVEQANKERQNQVLKEVQALTIEKEKAKNEFNAIVAKNLHKGHQYDAADGVLATMLQGTIGVKEDSIQHCKNTTKLLTHIERVCAQKEMELRHSTVNIASVLNDMHKVEEILRNGQGSIESLAETTTELKAQFEKQHMDQLAVDVQRRMIHESIDASLSASMPAESTHPLPTSLQEEDAIYLVFNPPSKFPPQQQVQAQTQKQQLLQASPTVVSVPMPLPPPVRVVDLCTT
jgi:hypothetical protein